MAGDILYEKFGRVRLITIDRADKMNSLDFDANDRLVDVWRQFAADDDAYAAVITGAGEKSFVAGADITAMREMNPLEAREVIFPLGCAAASTENTKKN